MTTLIPPKKTSVDNLSENNYFFNNKKSYCSTFLEISLSNITANFNYIKNYVGSKVTCSAVVKANAYGIGANLVSKVLAAEGCKDFWVANLDEAIELSKSISPHQFNIYVLHGIYNNAEAEECYNRAFIPVLNSIEQILTWNNTIIKYHKLPGDNISHSLPKAVLHIDTGMNRLGINEANLIHLLNNPDIASAINFTCVMSHLAYSEQKDNIYNIAQLQKFKQYANYFPSSILSLSNSSGIFLGYDYHLDLVRPGAAMYGISSVTGDKNNKSILPVITLKARVIQRNIIEAKQSVGYNCTFQTKSQTKLLTIEYGYADGYLCELSNMGKCYALGYTLPIVGRVSMDLCNVDASQLSDKEFESISYVELINDKITLDDLAQDANTIPYQILTNLTRRYRRIYS